MTLTNQNFEERLNQILSGALLAAKWSGYDLAAETPGAHVSSTPEEIQADAKAALITELNNVRIEELESVICHKHGFGKDSCPQIKSRLTTLRNGGDRERHA